MNPPMKCLKCKQPAIKNSSFCGEHQPKGDSGNDIYRMRNSTVEKEASQVEDTVRRILGVNKDK